MSTIGSFRIDRLLARGGMGAVWAATHTGGVAAAVKVLGGDHPLAAEALDTEVAALAALHHPSIVVLYDAGVLSADEAAQVGAVPGTGWVAMEQAGGGSLADTPPGSWSEVLHAAEAILGGLAHAHARGIIHRDLKPANVLRFLPTDLRPGIKLADFGIATGSAERDGRRLGTPRYMAPEQIRGAWDRFGPWTDLYAFGCVLHEWCAGGPAFVGDSGRDLALAHLRADRREFRPWFEAPAGLPALLDWLLEPDPSRRPDRAAEVWTALVGLGDADGPVMPVGASSAGASDTMDLGLLDGPDPTEDAPASPASAVASSIPEDWRGAGPPRSALLHNVGRGLVAHRVPAVAGREAEQDLLWNELRGVTPGSARVVSLDGEPGAGATRLARWLLHCAHELGAADTLELRAGPGLAGDLVRGLLGAEGLDPEALRDRVVGRLPDQPDLADALVETLRGGGVPAPLAAELLRTWSGRRPLVVLIDEGSAEDVPRIRPLVGATTPAGLLVLLCGARWPEAGLHLTVGPLAPEAHRELVTTFLGLSSRVADLLETRGHRLPGLTLALARHWVSQGALVPTPSGFDLTPGHEDALPADLQQAWTARLGALRRDAPAVVPALRRLAALGTGFDPADVEAVGGPSALREALRAGVVVPDGRGWRFASAVAREVLAIEGRAGGAWPNDRRWAGERLRSRWPTQPERWAEALLDAGGATAVDEVVEAVDDHLRPDPLQAAVLHRCLALVPDDAVQRRIRILGLLARLDIERGRYADAEAWIARAEALDPDHLDVIVTRAMLAAYRRDFGQVIALTEAAVAGDPENHRSNWLLRLRAMAFTERRETQAALDTWRTIFERRAASGRPPGVELLRSHARALATVGRHEEAQEQCLRALEEVRQGGDRLHEGRVTNELAHLATLREDWPEVVRRADRAERLLARYGVASEVYASFYGAFARWRLGLFDDLVPRIARLERLAEVHGVPHFGGGAALLAADLHCRQGEWEAVEADLHRARAMVEQGEPHRGLAAVATASATVAREAGRLELAARLTGIAEKLAGG